MIKFNGQHIVCDALLAYVLEFCYIGECLWVCYERRHVDRDASLKLRTTLTTVLMKTQDNVSYMMRLVALRLVFHDV